MRRVHFTFAHAVYCDARTVLPQRLGRCLQDLNDLQSFQSGGIRFLVVAYAIDKVLAQDF